MKNNPPSDLPGNNLDNFLDLEVKENNPHLVLQRFFPNKNLLISLLARRLHDGPFHHQFVHEVISIFMLYSFWRVYFKLSYFSFNHGKFLFQHATLTLQVTFMVLK